MRLIHESLNTPVVPNIFRELVTYCLLFFSPLPYHFSLTSLNFWPFQKGSFDKNWWLVINDEIQVGYWPLELFTHMAEGADTVTYGGTASAGKNGISPPMGSGHKPDGNWTHAAYFNNVRIVNENDYMRLPGQNEMEEFVDRVIVIVCKIIWIKVRSRKVTFFAFGGPGGINC